MQLLLFPHAPPSTPENLLSSDEQHEVLQSLLRGGSPQAACVKLAVPPLAFCRTVAEQAAFRTKLSQARELMTLNVVATVYRAAMEGTPAAQALWLRTFPPAEWAEPPASTANTTSHAESSDDSDSLPNDDLRRILSAFHERYAGWLRSEDTAEPA